MSSMDGTSTLDTNSTRSLKQSSAEKGNRSLGNTRRSRKRAPLGHAATFSGQRGLYRPVELKGHQIELCEEDIFKEATHHKKFEVFGKYSLSGLPRFDDLSLYNINDDVHDTLLKHEIKRLVETAKASRPYLFNSKQGFDNANTASYEELSALASQILSNAAVVTLDNATMILESQYTASVILAVATSFKSAYQMLRQEYFTDEKYGAQRSHPSYPSETHRNLYFAMIDFVTGSTARLLVRIAVSAQWNNQHIAVLAQLAVKLKFLSKSSKEYARLSMERAEEIVASLDQKELQTVEKLQKQMEKDGHEKSHVPMNEETELPYLYFVTNFRKRVCYQSIFVSAVSSLQHSLSSHRGFEDFHHHAVIYETGLDRSLVVVSEDRNGYVSTTSAAQFTRTCCRALTLVKQNVEEVRKTRPPPSSEDTESCTITLEWAERQSEDSEPTPVSTQFDTTKLDGVISVLVPLALSTPSVSPSVDELLMNSALPHTSKSKTEGPIRRFKHTHFVASCSVQTSTNRISQQNMRAQDLDTASMSHCRMIGRLRAGTLIDKDLTYARTYVSQDSKLKTISGPAGELSAKLISQYNQEDQKMSEWVFATTTVTVRCRGFVLSIILFCGLMITGALILPFFVKDKIRGVDPFQITTFTWFLAGVILITAKGRYVKEWPWHDFMHGRVVCDSITDLADVSRVDKQMILMKLLNTERAIALLTRGPYNGMFDRRSEVPSEGFSIDEPVQLSTMLASGFLILKVVSHEGEHLICLDARKKCGVDYAHSNASGQRYLACLDMPSNDIDSMAEMKSAKASRTVLYLSQNHIGWHNLIGLYVADAYFG